MASWLQSIMKVFIENVFVTLKGPRRRKKPRLILSFTTPEGIVITGGSKMAVVLTNTQKVTASITPLDAHGNPAPVDGIPAWSSSNPDIAAILAAEDGLSAVIIAQGPIGDTQISVVADADLGDGITEIVATGDLSVRPEQAVSLALNFGTPEAQ